MTAHEMIEKWDLPRWLVKLPDLLGSGRVGQSTRGFLGPAPGAREIEVACVVGIVISILMWGAAWFGQGGFLHGQVGQDFSAFYNAGRILNQGLADRLYDIGLQTARYQELAPNQGGTELFPSAPWLAIAFRPLAMLPFRTAYVLWVGISAALYLAGLGLIWPVTLDRASNRLVALAALSFHPFIIETLHSGQVAALAFFFIAAGTRLLRSERPFLAGCVLSGCLYKPTMLVLVVPMLIVVRRWRAVAGILAGGVGLLIASWVGVGRASVSGYIDMMRFYSELTSSHRDAFLAWEKFVDGNHFFRSLPGGGSPAMTAAAVIAALFLGYLLVVTWFKVAGREPEIQDVAWGATIALTLVLNLHAQHYDAILIVISMLVCVDAISRREDAVLKAACFRVAMLLWMLPWVSQALTRATGVQFFSLAILLLGLLLVATARRLGIARQPSLAFSQVTPPALKCGSTVD